MHPGTTAKDSAGCILIGKNTIVGKLTDSWNTWKKLYLLMKSISAKGEKIFITIE